MIIAPHADPVAHNLSKAKVATFNVAKNPQKLIQVVVRSLYSNPTLATLVELGQNAHDEHKRSGKADVPFEVVLPTVFEPTLRVRDFGRGIPHEYMMKGYTHIFESTKDSDGDMSGGYGVGRCVVLSLSSTYTVVTYIQGKMRTYSVFESDKGIELIHLSTEDTNEPDGTLITAPVSQNDIQAFRTAVHRAYRYYTVQPIIKGAGQDFALDKPEYVIQGMNWAIENDTTSPKAICGIYQYDILPENMGNLSNAHSELLADGGLVLRFGPSDLDVQANRQGLHYNDRTRTAIINALKVVENEAGSLLGKTFDSCSSYYQAKLKWAEYYGSVAMRKISKIAKSIGTITWKGIPIDSDRVEFVDGAKIVATGYRWTYNHRAREYRVKHEVGYSYFECNSKWHIFINDMPGGKGAIQRVKAYLRNIKSADGSCDNGQYAITIFFNDAQAKVNFFKHTNLEEGDFKLVSSLPKPTATRGEGNINYNRARTKVFVYDGEDAGYNDRASDSWNIDEDIDLEEGGGIYVALDKYKARVRNDYKKPYYLNNVIKQIKEIGGFANGEELIGIRESANAELAIVRNSPNWKSLDQYIEELVNSYQIDAGELQLLADAGAYDKIPYNIKRIIDYNYQNQVFFAPLKNILDAALNIKAKHDSAESIASKHASYRSLGGVINKNGVTPSIDIGAMYEGLVGRFPVLKVVDNYTFLNNLAIVQNTLIQLERVELMDAGKIPEEIENVA